MRKNIINLSDYVDRLNSEKKRKTRRRILGISFIAVVLMALLFLNLNAGPEKLTLIGGSEDRGEIQFINDMQQEFAPQIDVPVDLDTEGNTQKSVDEGHSPWRLDPKFTAQVFVSLKISPEGIAGNYPIKYENLSIVYQTGTDTIVEVTGETPIKRVYLRRLIRQDPTGIWTVVGYDPDTSGT